MHHHEHETEIGARDRGLIPKFLVVLIGAALLGLLVWGGIALIMQVPAAFRWGVGKAIDAVPLSVDEKIGQAAIASMDLGGARIQTPIVDQLCQTMLARLTPAANRNELRFRLRVIGNEQINAFALPGGEMVVFSGLLSRASGAEQVAGVLAHEMAHVSLRHGMLRMIQSFGIVSGMQLFLGDAGGLLALGKELFTLAAVNGYSRHQEAEADAEALFMLARAGVDPQPFIRFFELLQAEGQKTPALLGWLGTHPNPEERTAALRAKLAAIPTPAQRRPIPIAWATLQQSLRTPALPAEQLPGERLPTQQAPR